MHKKLLSFLFLAVCGVVFGSETRKASDGLLDLASFQFSPLKTVQVEGSWEFWWGEFISPEAFSTETFRAPDSYPVLPSYWTSGTHGKQYPAKGSATYRLTIRFPNNDVYGIYLPQMVSAYDLYINGIRVGNNGKARVNPDETQGEYRPRAYYFAPIDGKAEIVLHVSNRDYRFGGHWKAPLIGYASAIQNEVNRTSMEELFLFGAVLIIGLYNIAVFLFRTQNKSPLFFGLFCLIIAVRIVTTGTIAIGNIFPGFSWPLQIKLELSIFYLGSIFFGLFFRSLYPKDIPLVPLLVVLSPFAVFTLLALFTPLAFFNALVTPMEIATVVGLGFVLVCIAIAAIRGRDNAWLVLAGFVVFFLSAVNDILFSKNILHTAYLVPFGLFTFIFIQAVNLAKIFSNSFTQVERLSHQLSTVNKSLTRFVPNEFLAFLNKTSITDVNLGDQTLRDISILFADIQSFTTLSETMSPQDNFNFLNSYLGRIGPIIRENHGFIDKYIGDAIMALFASGTKLPTGIVTHEDGLSLGTHGTNYADGAENAVRAGLAMYSALKEYNEERREHSLVPIEIGIGIHTGQVMLGIIGEQQRIESTVISDTVNVASRIERLTRMYLAPVIISGSLVRSLDQHHNFMFRRLDEVVVKGKSKSCDIHQVLDIYKGEELERFLSTKDSFERAVELYGEKQYIEAMDTFKQCYYANRADKTCLVYIQKIKKAIQIESVIKELETKQQGI